MLVNTDGGRSANRSNDTTIIKQCIAVTGTIASYFCIDVAINDIINARTAAFLFFVVVCTGISVA